MPLRSTRVIPTGWENQHRPVTEGAMTATCSVRDAAPGNPAAARFDPQTGRTVYPDPKPLYAGPCRVTHVPQHHATDAEVGLKDTPMTGYALAVPLSAPSLPVGAVVTINTATDPAFAGAKLVIIRSSSGSLTWQRTYNCEEWSTTVR
jgi:hypothetical protein